jgi:Domain of unknown function (DUF1929)
VAQFGGFLVRQQHSPRWWLVGVLAASAACHWTSGAAAEDGAAPADRADRSAGPEVDGTWTPLVTLRDTTNTFPGDNRIARPPDGWWVAPIHANLLADGKVLVTGWNRPVEKLCRDHQGRLAGTSFLLDVDRLGVAQPTTLEITPLNEQPRDPGDVLYCAGHAPLADGRILFMGGARYLNLGVAGFPAGSQAPYDESAFRQEEFGLNYARIFDPATGEIERVKWTNPGGPVPPSPRTDDWKEYQTGDMWYPSNTRLPGGKILINGGYSKWMSVLNPKKWDYLNRSVTLFDPAAFDAGKDPWTVLVSHEKSAREVSIDVFDYPHAFVLPEPVTRGGHLRHVLIYGGGYGSSSGDPPYTPGVTLLSLSPDVPEDERFFRPPHAARPAGGMLNETTASMTSDGAIVIMGGGNNGLAEGQRIDVYDPHADEWYSVDTGITRHKPTSTLLPDGTVLIAGGEEFYATPRNVGDMTRPTLFDPRTKTVANLARWADDPGMRGYHAVSLLLKDGRVLIGGGRIYAGIRGDADAQGQDGAYRIGCERPELRVFSPPYLFKGRRPVIAGAPREVPLGGKDFTVKFHGPAPRADGGVVLMALGAYTHSFDQNQRAVPLKAVKGDAPGEVTVTPPADAWAAPEGDYNLFLVSDRGVPSVATSVRIVAQ